MINDQVIETLALHVEFCDLNYGCTMCSAYL